MQVGKEFAKCADLVSIWDITRGDLSVGKITVRYSCDREIAHIALEIHPPRRELDSVYGYERVRVYGSKESIANGITQILMRHRKALKEDFGIEIREDGDVLGSNWWHWMHFGEHMEYTAARVI